ncbi:hypothetical protein VNI00_015382 [Paramarasmius palmivorus]|uniref:DUF6593 domain-containing protein n=1 Tax=Paramarasmius palmivorus TaxID=297713 RepID=A0AAW0BLL5_9AGAR
MNLPYTSLFVDASGFAISGGEFNFYEASSLRSPPSVGSVETEYTVYVRMLLTKKKGYPLWNPSVSNALPLDYRKIGVSIGDVGSISEDGSFQYLFNIFLPADAALNRARGVPNGFSPLSRDGLPPAESYDDPPGTHIANTISSTISKTELKRSQIEPSRAQDVENALRANKIPHEVRYGFKFSTNSSEGAILVLPEGGTREDQLNKDIFEAYAETHAISWYQHANRVLGQGLGCDSLLLVTGTDKTAAWGVVSFRDATEGMSLTMVPDARTQCKYQFQFVLGATARTGPQRNNIRSVPPEDDGRNQCVFVRGIQVSVRPPALFKRDKDTDLSVQTRDIRSMSERDIHSEKKHVPFKRKRQKKPSGVQQTNEGSQGLEVATMRVPPGKLLYHPLTVINSYILDKFPNADVALCHDQCWFELIADGESTFPCKSELISRVEAKYDIVVSNGVARLVPREVNGDRSHILQSSRHPTSSRQMKEASPLRPAATTVHADEILSRTNEDRRDSVLFNSEGSSLRPISRLGAPFLFEAPPFRPAATTVHADEILSWTNEDPRDSVLFNSGGIVYRFQTTKGITTLWRTMKAQTGQRVAAKIEWSSSGGLPGRSLIGKDEFATTDLVKSDSRIANHRGFKGPDGLQYQWRPESQTNGKNLNLFDRNETIIALYRSMVPKRFRHGVVVGELRFRGSASTGVVMHPAMMDFVTVTSMLYRLCQMLDL